MKMSRCRAMLFVLLAITVSASCSRTPPPEIVIDSDEFADLQQVQIYRAESNASATTTAPAASNATAAATHFNGIALLLGTGADWRSGSAQMASRLAGAGWLVAGINFDNFVNARKAQNADCLDLVTLLDVFSQHLQEKYRVSNYQRPLLIGYQQGGSLAYLTLAQSSNGIFRGAVSLGIDAEIALPIPFCDHEGASTRMVGGKAQLLPLTRIAASWSLWSKSIEAPALQSLLKPLQSAHAHAKDIRHDDDIDDWLPTALNDIDPHGNTAVADLPLVEMPLANSSADYFAVVISGDGGWANIDRDIGNTLNARGIAVVGWNSLQYFWNRRTPQSAADDLTRVMKHYREQWHKPRVLLVGYSLGADVLPFMLTRMPQTEIGTIASVALLSVSTSVDFEFHVSNWIGGDADTAQKTAPELEKISALPVQCFYGSDDDDDACRGLKAPPNWHVVELPGDHHFDGAYEKVTGLLLANVPPAAPVTSKP